MIRVVLPTPLRTLAQVGREVQLELDGTPTVEAVLDALEARYPVLRGTLRDPLTHERRPFIRFFACQQDLSHAASGSRVPEAIATGAEPLLVVGAMAGG